MLVTPTRYKGITVKNFRATAVVWGSAGTLDLPTFSFRFWLCIRHESCVSLFLLFVYECSAVALNAQRRCGDADRARVKTIRKTS